MADISEPEYVVSYAHRVKRRQSSGTLYSHEPRFAPRHETGGDDDSCKSRHSGHDANEKRIFSMAERWAACSQAMEKFDDATVRGWKEDIDSLLVFAGLFSAVITAFIIEIYKHLQPDPAELSMHLLVQISLQLASPNSTLDMVNPRLLQGDAAPANYVIRISIVWVTALVSSLIAALISIVAKQWLREYLTGMSTSPRESVRLRQFRHDGLVRWHVAEIIGFLPVFLQIALVLFLYGLLELLWTLDNTVAGVVTGFTVASLSFYVATTIAPAFFVNNPFKSPQSWAVSVCIWKLVHFCTKIKATPHAGIITGENIGDLEAMPGNWRDREVIYMRVRTDLDQRALARAYKHFLDEDFLDVVFPCANDLQPQAAASLAIEFLIRRAECSESALLDSIRSNSPRLVIEKFILRAGVRGSQRLIQMLLDVLPRMLRDVERSKITPLDILFILRKLLTTDELALCEIESHRKALDTLALTIGEGCAEHVQQDALHLLWEMTHRGCNMDHCPAGIVNVILCARNAYSKRDHDTFMYASGILLARLSAPQSHVQDPRWNGHAHMRGWIHDLESFFHERNETNLQYDPSNGVRMKWCSGLAAVAAKDRDLLCNNLIVALVKGAWLGLVDSDLEEGDALYQLRHAYITVQRDSA